MIEPTRFPLAWPVGQPRTKHRRNATFKVGLRKSIDDLQRGLDLLQARNLVLSSNLPLRLDGTIVMSGSEPSDPAVAVYFDRFVADTVSSTRVSRSFVIACDAYLAVRWNVRAIGATVDALRAIERHGATSMLEQAFSGFAALPPGPAAAYPSLLEPWWIVLAVSPEATLEQITEAYRSKAFDNHPDRGGSTLATIQINQAYAAGVRARGAS